MKDGAIILNGVVRGKVVELEQEPGLPDGQRVAVTLTPSLPPGEGLRRSFGAWAEDAAELEEFERQLRRDRQSDRPELTD